MNCRREQERRDSQPDQSFSQVLASVKDEDEKTKETRKQDKLRMLGGLNQYNRHAVEFCFMLSSETDLRA